MKELKVGDSFLFTEDLWEVTEVGEQVYFAKILSKQSSTTLSIMKTHSCFQTISTKVSRHIHTLKLYQGFTDTYQYCTECDHKEKA